MRVYLSVFLPILITSNYAKIGSFFHTYYIRECVRYYIRTLASIDDPKGNFL